MGKHESISQESALGCGGKFGYCPNFNSRKLGLWKTGARVVLCWILASGLMFICFSALSEFRPRWKNSNVVRPTANQVSKGMSFDLPNNGPERDVSTNRDKQTAGLVLLDQLAIQIKGYQKTVLESISRFSLPAFGRKNDLSLPAVYLPLRSVRLFTANLNDNFLNCERVGSRVGSGKPNLDYFACYLSHSVNINYLALGVSNLYVNPLSQSCRLNFGLLPDRPEGLQRHDASPPSDERQYPVWNICRGVEFAPLIRLALGAVFLFGGSFLYLDGTDTRFFRGLGVAVFVLGWLLLLAPVPWDLGPCSQATDGERRSQQQELHIQPPTIEQQTLNQ